MSDPITAAAEVIAVVPPLFSTASLIALLTLTSLEIVLGIDNIIFLSILTGRLPPEQRPKARRVGLILAMVMRIGLLCAASFLITLVKPIIPRPEWMASTGLSGKDLILLLGGLFLIGKATYEIHHKVEGHDEAGHVPGDGGAGVTTGKVAASFASVLVQIMIIDIVFSLDSVITAVGMAQHLEVMIAAVMISVGVMMVAAGPIGTFVENHPAFKILALAFLILIGCLLVAEGWGGHVEKGYIYFAMAFAFSVELLQLRMDLKRTKH